MKNTIINRKAISKVAKALGDLNKRVVFVGGALVSYYTNDPAAEDIRPTQDIDISVEIASLSELEELRQDLIKKGFYQSAEDHIICRFRYEDIKIDVMGTKEIGWAPANLWFASGFKHKETVQVEEHIINILSLPYFLATKFSAFHGRGEIDPRTSHDLEDITYILDNQSELENLIIKAPDDVVKYLKAEFRKILESDILQEAIRANLFYETQSQRFDIIVSKLKGIVK